MDALHSSGLCVCSTTEQPGFLHEYVANFNPPTYLEDFILYISTKSVDTLDFTILKLKVTVLSQKIIVFLRSSH